MIRGIIFDCFGVLHLRADEQIAVRFADKRAALYEMYSRADHGVISREEYIEEMAVILGVSQEEVLRLVMGENTLNEPLITYITGSLRPQFKIALLSNIGRGWLEKFFTTHQLHDLFDVMVLSSDEGIIKPHPLMYERTAQRLGLAPAECLMIDDSEENCLGAEAVGMRSLLFTDNNTLYAALNTLKIDQRSTR